MEQETNDLRVTKEDYLSVKEKDTLSSSDLEIVSRAAEYGFKTVEPEIVEDEIDEPEIVDDGETSEADVIVDDVNIALKYERELRLQAEREKVRENEVLQAEIDKLRQQALKPNTSESETNVAEALNINIDDFESEYDMMKYKIDKLSNIITTQSVKDPRLDAVLNELEVFKETKKREQEEQDRIRQEKLFREDVESFWNNVGDMKPSTSFDEAEKMFASLKSKTAEVFGSDEVDKLFVRLVDPAMAENTRKMFSDKGIEVPDDFYPVYNTLKVYDYMNGYKVDPVTGERKKVTTVSGNVQTLENIETAYYVMDRKNYLTKMRRDITRGTQQQLEKVTGGATTIPVDRLDSISSEDTMSQERMANILADIRRDPMSYNRDPEKIQLKQEVYHRLGIN